jgi:hypothetical protein
MELAVAVGLSSKILNQTLPFPLKEAAVLGALAM